MRKAYLGQTGVFSDSECSCELTGEKSQLIVITSNLDKELFTLHYITHYPPLLTILDYRGVITSCSLPAPG